MIHHLYIYSNEIFNINEPQHEQTTNFHKRKQSRRSAVQ